MDESCLRGILDAVREGRTGTDEAVATLRDFGIRRIGDVAFDADRPLRRGVAEAIFAERKSDGQLGDAVEAAISAGGDVLVTRLAPERILVLRERFPGETIEHSESGRTAVIRKQPFVDKGRGEVLVLSAGTADVPVALEAAVTAEFMGNRVIRGFDVGVAGLHRLIPHLEALQRATVAIVVAGMEGALPSVVAGLAPCPVIAVPTSVGYGASFGGIAALLAMLNSCTGQARPNDGKRSPGLQLHDMGIACPITFDRIAPEQQNAPAGGRNGRKLSAWDSGCRAGRTHRD